MRKYLFIFLLSLLFNFPCQADHQNEPFGFDKIHKYKIGKSENYHKFDFDLQDNDLSKKVEEQLKNKKKTNLVSYLLYEDGKIKVDQKVKSKYTNWYYPSHSIGKSLVSVVTGYAVCEGYIDSVHNNIDYPTVKNTLYENQKLLHLLNMTAGDELYLGERYGGWDSRMMKDNQSINSIPIKTAMKRYFQGTKRFNGDVWNTSTGETSNGLVYNYSAMTTNIIMNYVIYKTDDDWEKLLHKVFTEDAKVKNEVYFGKTLSKSKSGNIKKGEYGRYTFYAQRDDYLRIGLMVMNHWNNDSCVGKYLKTMYENRVDKNKQSTNTQSASQYSHSYGGQFHFDIVGLEDKKILAMDGFGGQQLIIDFDKKRIISVASTDRHYDWYEIVYKTLEKD